MSTCILGVSMNEALIKQDLNFLEYPNWTVSAKKKTYTFIIQNQNGYYEMNSPEGLPGRFDKVVLYFLLYKFFELDSGAKEVVTTRYEIAKNVLFQDKNFSKTKYDRIMLALKRWKSIYIRFEGVFFEKDSKTVKYFSIVDYVLLDKTTNKLSIKFNAQYINQLNESNFYRYINFNEYKKLTRPVSARLYEILLKNLALNDLWCINIENLGEKLTLEKRFYPSHILVAIKPAIKEINEYTAVKIAFDYDKSRSLCIFNKI